MSVVRFYILMVVWKVMKSNKPWQEENAFAGEIYEILENETDKRPESKQKNVNSLTQQ